MNFGDTVNGLFEAFGALFTWRNALQLHRDQEIKGVYWPITGFFAFWGLWNLWYYPSLGQWLSFWAGCLLVLGNICWVAQAVGLWLRKRGQVLCQCGDVKFCTSPQPHSGSGKCSVCVSGPRPWSFYDGAKQHVLFPGTCRYGAPERGEARCPKGCGAVPPDAGLHHLNDCALYSGTIKVF